METQKTRNPRNRRLAGAFSLIITTLCVIPLVFSPFLATLCPAHNFRTIMDDDYFPVLKSTELLGHQFFCGVNRTEDAISSWIIRHNCLSLCRLTYVKSKELRSILSEVSESHRTTYRHCTPVEICNGNPALDGVRRRERQCRFSIAPIFHIRLTMKELQINTLRPASQGFACRSDAGSRGVSREHNATFSRIFLQNCEILPTFANAYYIHRHSILRHINNFRRIARHIKDYSPERSSWAKAVTAYSREDVCGTQTLTGDFYFC